jgi:hypothetical protein
MYASQHGILHTFLMKNNVIQKWKGLFHSPLVVQTFAVHLTAMEGALKVPGLHDPPHLTPAANGGLGLAVASVSIIYCPHQMISLTFCRWRGH